MNPNTPDHFNYRPWLAAAVSAAFFVPLLVLGGLVVPGGASVTGFHTDRDYTVRIDSVDDLRWSDALMKISPARSFKFRLTFPVRLPLF